MRKIAVLILIISLFVLGCGDQQAQTQGPGAFIGGTDAVTATFEPISIEEEGVFTIFDTESFPLDVIVRNVGEHDIEPGDITLRLLGPAQEDFRNLDDWELQNEEELEKISEFNPDGEEEIMSFGTEANYIAEVTGFTDINWNLEYEYLYETHLIIDEVCFKGDITEDRICEVQEPKSFSVSGAPITVTSVVEDQAGKGVMLLKIQVENANTGESTISGQEFDNRFNQIAFTEDSGDWECKSGGRENEARLVDNQALVICRLRESLDENDLFTRSVRLDFEYVYRDLIQEKLRVKESLD